MNVIRLTAEGLTEVRPQRGTYVSPISLSAVLSARLIREAVDAIAALPNNASFALRKALHDKLNDANPDLKAALSALEARHRG